MSARREHRLRNLERRVAELETIAATPVSYTHLRAHET